MKFIFLFIFVLSTNVLALQSIHSLQNELNHLSIKQKRILHRVYDLGSKYDLSYTMAAIAWRESNFGKYRVGRLSPDYGIFQINIHSFKRRFNDELFSFPVSNKKLVNMLTNDDDLNFTAALEEILFWKSVRGSDYMKIWASYNGGYKMNLNYANMILNRVKAIKIYMKKHEKDILW